MKDFPTWVLVVALALEGQDGRWLMHRRPEGKHHGGLWEFPGGKVEDGESPPAALVREIAEELGITLEEDALAAAGFAHTLAATEAERPIVILLYTCATWVGVPEALEGGAVAWFTPREVATLPKPPLDIALAQTLFGTCE